MVAFPKQGKQNNCGAFAVAYYDWLSSGIKQKAEGGAEIDEIYSKIKFGEDAPRSDLKDYSDPVKIMKYLKATLGVAKPIFYYTQGTIIENLLTLMKQGNSRDKIESWEGKGKVVASAPPLDRNGYLLSMCTQIYPAEVDKVDEVLTNERRIHYTLIRFRDGKYKMYNSWDGTSKSITSNFMNGELVKSGGDYLRYLNSGIWINENKEAE